MRHLIISDLHEDYSALVRALDAGKQVGGYDDIWFLGDVLGRHGDASDRYAPIQCLTLLQEVEATCVIGNWEGWLQRLDQDVPGCHEKHWQSELQALRASLPEDLLEYIQSWDWIIEEDDYTLTHGCPYKRHDDDYYRAEAWESYIKPHESEVADTVFSTDKIQTQHLVIGHTHQPGYFHYNGQTARWRPLTAESVGRDIPMDGYGGRYILNPGSVSYNRNSVPWPTALLLDTQDRYFCFLQLEPTGRNK